MENKDCLIPEDEHSILNDGLRGLTPKDYVRLIQYHRKSQALLNRLFIKVEDIDQKVAWLSETSQKTKEATSILEKKPYKNKLNIIMYTVLFIAIVISVFYYLLFR